MEKFSEIEPKQSNFDEPTPLSDHPSFVVFFDKLS